MPSQDATFNLQKFITSVVIVGLFLVVGIYITSEIGTTTLAENTAGSAVNESVLLASIEGAGATLTANSLTDGSCSAITQVFNGTGGVEIGVGNFTQTGCVLTNATVLGDLNFTSSTFLVSYPYTYSAATAASNGADDVVDALATGTSWISILVVVGFATIVLTMLTSGLGSAAEVARSTPYY